VLAGRHQPRPGWHRQPETLIDDYTWSATPPDDLSARVAMAGLTTSSRDLKTRGVPSKEASRPDHHLRHPLAWDVLRTVYDGPAVGRPGVDRGDPRVAKTRRSQRGRARALWWMGDRQNLFIRSRPVEGFRGSAGISEGSASRTLIFSRAARAEVIESTEAWRRPRRAGMTSPDCSVASASSAGWTARSTQAGHVGTPAGQGACAGRRPRERADRLRGRDEVRRGALARLAPRLRRPAAAVGIDLDQGPSFIPKNVMAEMVVAVR